MNAKAPTDLQLDDALRAPISGRHLEGSTLGEEVGTERTLLVFLRHFG